jgi:hypothetical protein
LAGFGKPKVENDLHPSGYKNSLESQALEAGSSIFQSNSPVKTLDIYLVAFHPMKDHPNHQMEMHHYCHQVNEDFKQCVLYDGNTKHANLVGIEYIISDTLFESLPSEEKKYWHPHNYEVLSGQLIAPGLPKTAEKELMKKVINTYGKTWHLWDTGTPFHAGHKLPLGNPKLAWSFNHDHEINQSFLNKRDDDFKISTKKKQKEREDLIPLARPQEGVNDLLSFFPKAKSIQGVVAR